MGKIKGKMFMKNFKAVFLSIFSVIMFSGMNFCCVNNSANVPNDVNIAAQSYIEKLNTTQNQIKTKKCNIMNPNRKRTC